MVLSCFLIISLNVNGNFVEDSIGQNIEDSGISDLYLTTDPHIDINNDDDFNSYNLTGSGSQVDPFLIENFTISTVVHEGISIFNTTKYFVIRNCIISSGVAGISIESVAYYTAIIENNTISCSSDADCISLTQCSGAEIRNNICKNGLQGISLYDSNLVKISNNTCVDNNDDAINLYGCARTVIQYNNCSGNILSGITLFISGTPSIINNTCNQNNWHGIFLSYCTSATVANNTCLDNNQSGLTLSYTSVLTSNNTFSLNGIGIRLGFSDGGNFIYNLIEENSGYGMYLSTSSDNNIIHHNTFLNNNIGGESQAYDTGTGNIWCDELEQVGNFWSDWYSSEPYPIDGPAGAFDPYPSFNENTETPTTTSYVGVIVIANSIICVVLVMRRKIKNSPK